jgi:hypothetical protein
MENLSFVTAALARSTFGVWLLSLGIATSALGNSGGTHELAFNYRYESAKSPVNSYSNHEIQVEYLTPFSFLWTGIDLKYGNHHFANNNNATILEIGGLAKYWIIDPGDSVGFNLFSGFSLGKENTGTDPVTTTTFKTGPELAWFIWEGASATTRIQYSIRRAGPTYTVVGVHSGLSLFF